MKRDKYLQKALEALNIKLNDNRNAYTEKDIDRLINEEMSTKQDAENGIINLQQCLIDIDNNIEILNQIKHQMKVERYKELNPDKEIF